MGNASLIVLTDDDGKDDCYNGCQGELHSALLPPSLALELPRALSEVSGTVCQLFCGGVGRERGRGRGGERRGME